MTAKHNPSVVDLKVNLDTVRPSSAAQAMFGGTSWTDISLFDAHTQVQKRFSFPASLPDWAELSAVIKDRFGLPEHFPLGLNYLDGEDEAVTM